MRSPRTDETGLAAGSEVNVQHLHAASAKRELVLLDLELRPRLHGGESHDVDDDGNEIAVSLDELRLVSSSTSCDLPPRRFVSATGNLARALLYRT